jgi:uncharacterized protein YbjT (DUF2867 family)
MRILVTGTSGFIGQELSWSLLKRGHSVVGLSRDPARVNAALAEEITLIAGDALDERDVALAMDGCDSFAWLVHSMESTSGGKVTPFADTELAGARAAVAGARRAGVERCVYLGGIVPEEAKNSPHLASRLAVEETLIKGLPGATALRASIVIGERSRSFRFLVRLVERLPALPLPAWASNRTAPIDSRDAIAALVSALEETPQTRSLDIAGPDTLTYGELIGLIADRMLVDRPPLRLPFSLTPIAGQVAAAIAGEDPALILPLMESLETDLLPRADGLRELGVQAHSLSAAVDRALRQWEQNEELGAR